MKICLFSFFLFVSFSVLSQIFDYEKLGVCSSVDFKVYNSQNDNFGTFRANLTYDIGKFRIIGGLVFSEDVDLVNIYDLKSHIGLTGFTIGTRYYTKFGRKGAMYYFLENMLLNYHTYETKKYYYYQQVQFSGNRNAGNKTLILQPIIGSGAEVHFLGSFYGGLDCGFGYTIRRMKYDRPSSFDTKSTGFSCQLRFNLGFTL